MQQRQREGSRHVPVTVEQISGPRLGGEWGPADRNRQEPTGRRAASAEIEPPVNEARHSLEQVDVGLGSPTSVRKDVQDLDRDVQETRGDLKTWGP